MSLPCVSCGTKTNEGQVRFFVKICLCPGCEEMAKSLRSKAISCLENSLATIDTLSRDAIMGHRFVLTREMVERFNPVDALSFLLAVEKNACLTSPSLLTDDTKPLALTATSQSDSSNQ